MKFRRISTTFSKEIFRKIFRVSSKAFRVLSAIVLVGFALNFTAKFFGHVRKHSDEYKNAASLFWRGRCSLPFIQVSNYSFLTRRTFVYPGGVTKKMTMLRNVTKRGFIIPNPDLCTENVNLLVTVLAAPANVSARNAIRETWGNSLQKMSPNNVKVAFVLGATRPDLQKLLDEEQEIHKDLIQSVNADHHRKSLTMKEVSLFEWLKEFCPRVKFVLKTDDDVYVNPRQLLEFAAQKQNATNSMFGFKNVKHCTEIDFDERYTEINASTPPEVYPYFHVPPVISQSYFYTADVVNAMVKAIDLVPFWTLVSDEYVTGILAEVAGVKRISEPRFNAQFGDSALKMPRSTYKLLFGKMIVVSHNQLVRPRAHVLPEQMREIHQILS